MKISEARKGVRVTLRNHPKPTCYSYPWRLAGTLTSGRVRNQLPGHEEGLFVRVKWDATPTPENWNIADLTVFAIASRETASKTLGVGEGDRA